MKESCDRKYVCPYSKEIKSDMLNGYTTYEVSLVLQDDSKNGNIYAVYGDRGHPMVIPPAFQIDNIGVNIGGTNPIINNNTYAFHKRGWKVIQYKFNELDKNEPWLNYMNCFSKLIMEYK